MNLRQVAERILAPRTLLVDTPFGALLGAPHDQATQTTILDAAFNMLVDPQIEPGEIRELTG